MPRIESPPHQNITSALCVLISFAALHCHHSRNGFLLLCLKPFKLNWVFIERLDCVLTLWAQLPHGHIKTQTKVQILIFLIAKQNHSQRNFEDVHSLCNLGRMDRPSASLKPEYLSGLNTCGPAGCP